MSVGAPGTTGARQVLEMWTVYDHPRDAPAGYRARQFLVYDDVYPTDQIIDELTLEAVRRQLARKGLTRIPRSRGDDPVILETWL